MNTALIPYQEFNNTPELAARLFDVVNDNRALLVLRGLSGVIARYGTDIETAEHKVRKGQDEQEMLGHFAVVSATGDVVGAASIFPELKLRRLRLPLPPLLAKGPLAIDFPHAKPNIHAWTSGSEIEALSDAYASLYDKAQGPEWQPTSRGNAWTVKPLLRFMRQ